MKFISIKGVRNVIAIVFMFLFSNSVEAQCTAGFTVNTDPQCLFSNNYIFTNTGSTGAGVTYTWDFDGDLIVDNTTENPSFSYILSGTYTVTQTVDDGNGCVVTATMDITLIKGPSIAGDSFVCVDATIDYVTSGTADAVTPWVSSNTGVATIDNAGVVTGVSAGNVTITYLDIIGCFINTDITVNPLPTIAGNSPVCVGSTVQLTGSGTANAISPWISSDPSVATIDNTGLVTGVSDGISTITYTNDNDCEITEDVTVNALPTITGNSPICIDAEVQLIGSGTPDGVAPWTSSNTGVAIIDNTGLVTGVSGGVTTITYTDINGCEITEVVTVINPTITGVLSVCVGETIELTGSGLPAVVDPWGSDDLTIATIDDAGLVTGVSA